MFVEEKKEGELRELNEIGKTLLRAADLIETHGHKKHALYDSGKMCIAGAICVALGWDGKGMPYLSDEIKRAICRMGDFIEERNLAHWNNAPERTAAEVIAKLRTVALLV